MGRSGETQKSSGGIFVTGAMIVAAVLLGVSLLSNQDEVNRRAAEVERVQRDLVLLSEEIQHLTDQERNRASTLLEQESLARERLEWTAPGEFIIKIKEP